VTAVAVDNSFHFLAVGNCIGEVLILNLKSGGVLYKLPHTDSEVTCLKFLAGSKSLNLMNY
jgi:hypothetical protein